MKKGILATIIGLILAIILAITLNITKDTNDSDSLYEPEVNGDKISTIIE